MNYDTPSDPFTHTNARDDIVIQERPAWSSQQAAAVRAMHLIAAAPNQARPIYGHCLACGGLEVRLERCYGTRDFSSIGESDRYPVGYGCEMCS